MIILPGTFIHTFLLTLTIIIVITKFLLATYLLKKILEKRKVEGKLKVDFLFCAFIFMVALGISRILLIYFDFYLTFFDSSRFHLMPNILIWKIANFHTTISIFLLLFIIDKKVMNFKFKGVLSYVALTVGCFQLLYPVSTAEDFQLIQNVGMIGTAVSIILPIFFFYMVIKAPPKSDLRKISLALGLGIVIAALGGNFVSETFLVPVRTAYGDSAIITMWILALIFKITGYTLMAYGATKFKVKSD